MSKRIKILGLFLGLICITLTSLSAGASELYAAVAQGKIEPITKLLDKGENIEQRDELGSTPLHFAAREGANDILDTLTRRGADAHAKNNKGETPLDVARIKYLTDTAYQQLQAASK